MVRIITDSAAADDHRILYLFAEAADSTQKALYILMRGGNMDSVSLEEAEIAFRDKNLIPTLNRTNEHLYLKLL